MATPKQRVSADPNIVPIFVERQLGTITLDSYGTENPVSAALQIIGNDGDEGEYHFTLPASQGTPALRFDISIRSTVVDGE